MNAEVLVAVTAIWASGLSARTTYATQNPPQTPHRHTNPSAEPSRCATRAEPPRRATRAEPPTAHHPAGRSSREGVGGNPRPANPRRDAIAGLRLARPGSAFRFLAWRW